MIGRQEYQPTLFSTVNIESFIPKNHLLRKPDSILDFSFVREMTEHLYCSNNGRPSIDPELFFRIYLIIFLYGIESDRQDTLSKILFLLLLKKLDHFSLTIEYSWLFLFYLVLSVSFKMPFCGKKTI